MGLIYRNPALAEDCPNLEHFLKENAEAELPCKRTLPEEWFPQSGVQLTWPHRGTDWAYMLDEVTECYIRMAYEIAIRETLLVVSPEPDSVRALLENKLPRRATDHIIYSECPTNDTWARDHGFLTLVTSKGPELLDFRFDGWGGKFEAALDNAINRRLYDTGMVKGSYCNHDDFILEGGSIESDGEGTLLTTSTCLLNPNRNARLTKEEIEDRLCQTLGMEKILWLDYGHLEGDDTDAHIDTLARFCPNHTIAYVKCTDTSDPHYEDLKKMEEQLRTFTSASGHPYRLVPLPMPSAIYDEDGLRLPATYANFLFVNGGVLYPVYGQPENDEAARNAFCSLFDKADLVGIDCRSLIRQHGSLHCATMQYPRGCIRKAEQNG